ncbi:hypothetical protein OIU76_002653 [Salix suchowensis]|nr:hypothetical protein OIU76_002653 [Salix suchowensis]
MAPLKYLICFSLRQKKNVRTQETQSHLKNLKLHQIHCCSHKENIRSAQTRDLPSKFHQTLIPDLERISMTSKKYLTKANKDLTKGFKPFVGNNLFLYTKDLDFHPSLSLNLLHHSMPLFIGYWARALEVFLRHFTVHIRLLNGSSNPWLCSVLAAAVDVSDPGLFHRVWAELKAVRPGSDPGGLCSRAALLRGSVS